MVRLHLWKIRFVAHGWIKVKLPGFPRVLAALSPKTFGKFHNFFINFAVGIISWKYEACIWWVEIYSEMGQGPISPNLGELTEWASVLLQILTCVEGQVLWGKWGEITHLHSYRLPSLCMLYFIENKGLEFSWIVGLFLGVIF